jgi:hypothetical protein
MSDDTTSTTGPASQILGTATGSCGCSCCVLTAGQTDCDIVLAGSSDTGTFDQCRTFTTCSTVFPAQCPSNAKMSIQFQTGPGGSGTGGNGGTNTDGGPSPTETNDQTVKVTKPPVSTASCLR